MDVLIQSRLFPLLMYLVLIAPVASWNPTLASTSFNRCRRSVPGPSCLNVMATRRTRVGTKSSNCNGNICKRCPLNFDVSNITCLNPVFLGSVRVPHGGGRLEGCIPPEAVYSVQGKERTMKGGGCGGRDLSRQKKN